MSRYGVREIANVVFKDIATGKPALYLETLKTSSTEVTADAQYARGGRGNPKRIMWESNKEAMYNMQDALISAESLAILAGTTPIKNTVQVQKKEVLTIVEDGEAPNTSLQVTLSETPTTEEGYPLFIFLTEHGYDIGAEVIEADSTAAPAVAGYSIDEGVITFPSSGYDGHTFEAGQKVIVDYYYDSSSTSQRIVIESGKFPGYYKLEADTIWTREHDGALLPAKFTMPRIKIASSFTIDNAAEGEEFAPLYSNV